MQTGVPYGYRPRHSLCVLREFTRFCLYCQQKACAFFTARSGAVSARERGFAVSGGYVRILLSNDDGIHSPCLRALHRALCDAGHTLDVVAPLVEQSGVGCSVTLHSPLRLHPVKEEGFSGTAVTGTPVDCVKIALTTLLPTPPDLVVVGINNGANKGVDVFYSGTVGAATLLIKTR